MSVSFDEVGIALFVDRFAHTPQRMKSLFVALDGAFNRLGVTPTRLCAGRTVVKGSANYATYRGLRPRLMKSDFSDVTGFTIECLPAGRPTQNYRSWKSQASIGNEMMFTLIPQQRRVWDANWVPQPEDKERWQANWTLFPEDAGLTEQVVIEELYQVASLTIDEYGYIAWLKRGTEPALFDFGMGFPGDRISETWSHSRDQIWNRLTWTRFGCWTKRLLRDTFPINFLARSYLDLPIDGTTLEAWILADPLRRGTLEPFNGRVWVWKPVVKQIPLIREPLFRAGLLHWWGMFCINDYTQLQVTEPFKAPDNTPAMFRPEYYEGRDPKITR